VYKPERRHKMFLRAINVICFLITIATVIGSVELIIVSWTDFQIFQVCACQLAVCACCTVVYTWCVLWSRGKSRGCRPGQVFAPCMLPERRQRRHQRSRTESVLCVLLLQN
jgi:hypothetical protein